MTGERIGYRIRVSGRVQGVGFRFAAAGKARALGLSGYAENLPDGRVEVLACGTEAVVQELVAWLHHGPSSARVTGVEVESAADGEATADFAIR